MAVGPPCGGKPSLPPDLSEERGWSDGYISRVVYIHSGDHWDHWSGRPDLKEVTARVAAPDGYYVKIVP